LLHLGSTHQKVVNGIAVGALERVQEGAVAKVFKELAGRNAKRVVIVGIVEVRFSIDVC
jgi:hypothetical protein